MENQAWFSFPVQHRDTPGCALKCPSWQYWPHWLLQPWCWALAQGRNRHRTFSFSLEISLPHLSSFPLPGCSPSLAATAPAKQGLSMQAVCSLGSARNDPALGSHLAAGFTGFLSQPHFLGDPTRLAVLSCPHTSTRTPVLSSLQQFLMCCFFDLNSINLEWTFLGFPASQKATGTPELISC